MVHDQKMHISVTFHGGHEWIEPIDSTDQNLLLLESTQQASSRFLCLGQIFLA